MSSSFRIDDFENLASRVIGKWEGRAIELVDAARCLLQLIERGEASLTDTLAIGDLGDCVQAMAETLNVQSTNKTLEQRLSAIRETLTLMKRGLYGTCARCGKPIEDDRLEALHETVRCLACQTIVDYKNSKSKRHWE